KFTEPSPCRSLLPVAKAGYRQRVGGAHCAAGEYRVEDGLDEAVIRAAHRTLAVGADIDQLATLVPDTYCRTGGELLGTFEIVQWFQRGQRFRQAAVAAGFAHLVELHRLALEALEQFFQMLLVADVAGAARVPDVYEAHRPRALQFGGHTQPVA